MKFRSLSSFIFAVSVGVFAFSVQASQGKSKNLKVRTTAYTHTEADHIQYGRKTATGDRLKCGKGYTSAAADWSRYPVGTTFKIKGVDSTFVIDDYGSALVGTETIDLYHPSRGSMNRWGVRHVDIEILEFGDYEKSREILKDRTKYAHVREMLADIPKEKSAGPLGRMLAKNKAKTKAKSKPPTGKSTAPATLPAPKRPASASPPAADPEPVLLTSAAPDLKTPAPPKSAKSLPSPSPSPAWEDPAPKPAPPAPATAPAPATSRSPALALAPAPAASAPTPAPRATLPEPKPRKFVPLQMSNLELPPHLTVSAESAKPATTNRIRRFRPLPASWRPDV